MLARCLFLGCSEGGNIFSDEDIRKIREANDLVELFAERSVMRQRGKDFWCCCPFHQEKTPSCKVDSVSQTWHCFGCGEGGDIISYVRKLDDVDFVDAVRFLARRANIELTESAQASKAHSLKARLKAVCSEAASYYHMLLMRSSDEGPAAARTYLSGRGLGGSVPTSWNLGYAPGRRQLVTHLRSLGYTEKEMIEANVAVRGSQGVNDRFFNRVMFPISDVRGDCIAFGGRVIGQGEPKYLNTGDTPIFHKSEVLFALDKAKARMTSTGDAIVVEGYTDVIALHEAGFTNVVATLGTSLTRQHIRLLSHHAKSRIIYLFDGDEAGQRAADRALQFIDSSITPEAGVSRVDLCAVTLPDGLDPAEFVAAYGPDAFKTVLDGAIPLIKFGIDRRLSRYDLQTPEGRARATNEALAVLAPIKDSLLAKDYAVYISSRVHAREQDILLRLSDLKASAPVDYSDRLGADQPRKPSARVLSSAERNRLRTEREFLSLCAHNPAMIPDFMSELGQTEWHERVHGELSGIMMELISADPALTVADLIMRAQEKCKYAARILTASTVQSETPAHDTLRFLADELAIGDMESAISSMRDQMKQAQSDEERDMVFQAIYMLQAELNSLRANHVKTE